MSNTTTLPKFYGYFSTDRDGTTFKNYVLRVNNTFDNLVTGTVTGILDRERYSSKFASLRLLGVVDLPDNLFEYSIEVTPENVYFRGLTELSTRIVFVDWYLQHCPNNTLMMQAERVTTFIPKKKTVEELASDVPNLNIFDDCDY